MDSFCISFSGSSSAWTAKFWMGSRIVCSCHMTSSSLQQQLVAEMKSIQVLGLFLINLISPWISHKKPLQLRTQMKVLGSLVYHVQWREGEVVKGWPVSLNPLVSAKGCTLVPHWRQMVKSFHVPCWWVVHLQQPTLEPVQRILSLPLLQMFFLMSTVGGSRIFLRCNKPSNQLPLLWIIPSLPLNSVWT